MAERVKNALAWITCCTAQAGNYFQCPLVLKSDIDIASRVLWNGNIPAFETSHEKILTALEEMDVKLSRDYSTLLFEIHFQKFIALPILTLLGQAPVAGALLDALGFAWNTEGLENFTTWLTTFQKIFPVLQDEPESIMHRLQLFLAYPEGSIDKADVDSWIPSPKALAEMEQQYQMLRYFGVNDLTSFGALAYQKLGRDDDACELARLAVAPEQKTLKKTTLVTCHSILGQIAATRGEIEEADAHFARAVEEAKLSRLPMMELIAARDWKKHGLESAERDCSGAEAVIDGACEKMKKTREQLARVLA
jgi:hypothetical protein